MGSKLQRQNQHQRNLKKKIRKFEKKGLSISGLQKELAYCTGELDRQAFTTGHAAGDEKAQQRFAQERRQKQQTNAP